MSQIKELLTDENARKVAGDIVTAFEEASDKELDVDYHMSNGVMERKSIPNEYIRSELKELHGREVPAPNTAYSFNTKPNSFLWYLNDTMLKQMDKDEVSDEEHTLMRPFLQKIISFVNNDESLGERMRAAIRKTILNNPEEGLFPLKEVILVLFEFGDKEDYGDVVSIQNYNRFNKTTQQFVGEKKAIAQDLLKRRREFGYKSGKTTREIYDQIISEQKAAGNNLYEYILPEDVRIVQEAKECHMDVFVDYSPVPKVEFDMKAEELLKAAETEKSPS